MKGVVAELALASGLRLESKVQADPDARLHPTRQAELWSDSACIGVMGQIDPDKAQLAGIPEDTVLAEIHMARAYDCRVDEFKVRSVSKNPSVRRDIAFLIRKDVPFSKIEDAVRSAGGNLLEKQWLFDVYEGKGTGDGEHSLAIALQLRKLGANLTDEEANQVRAKVAEALVQLGATLR
jgi:phenylalanyl-tRNA synthetase beta chain